MRYFHRVREYLIPIIFFSLFAHGLLLLNDGVYWDGWLLYVAKFQDRWELTREIYMERGGIPLYTAFHWLMYQVPQFIFAYKLSAFMFILFSSIFIYRITEILTGNSKIGLFIGLIALVYPANQATVELIVIPYLLSYFLFWLGGLLLVLATQKKNEASWWHLAAIIALFLSFRMYSLLVFFYGFLLILFMLHWRQRQNKTPIYIASSFARSYAFYLVLPIFFWLVNGWLFPPSGPYATSDAFVWDLSIFRFAGSYFTNALWGQIRSSLANLGNVFVAVITTIASLVFANVFSLNRDKHPWFERAPKGWALFFGGIVFFLFGLFPYVVVGRSTTIHGWSTRNAILVGVPVALMIVGLILAVTQGLKGSIPILRLSKLTIFFVSMLIILFSVETAEAYLGWQLRAIKDKSVIANFGLKSKVVDEASIFIVYDEYPLGWEPKYRPHEYYGMFFVARPDSAKIGLDVYGFYFYNDYFLNIDEIKKEQLELWYPDLNTRGCFAELYIRPGQAKIDSIIYLRYFYFRFFATHRLSNYLYSITDLEIIPVDTLLASDC